VRKSLARCCSPAFTAMLVAVLAFSAILGGCTKGSSATNGDSQASRETTPGEFPDTKPPAPVTPPPPMTTDPEKSVYSYLLWISYAYRIAQSDVATHAFSEWEEVRVSSYIEKNRQDGKALDQRLIGFDVKNVESKGSTATVTTREQWAYRYIDGATETYSGKTHEAEYDVRYTVVKVPKKGWLVDSVKATPVGGQPE